MSGRGTFLTTNKILPGTYINFISKARAMGTVGERGTVALPYIGSWGAEGITKLDLSDFQTDSMKILGYDYTADEMRALREIFCGAKSVILYRLGKSTKASCSLDSMTVTAKYGGKRGNDIKVSVYENTEGSFKVAVYMDNVLVSEQTANNCSETENDFAEFSGELAETAGISLSGGEDATITGNDYSSFLSEIEKESFTTLLYAGSDDTTKALFTSFTKRVRDDDGYKISCVLCDYEKADYEGVISVKDYNDLVYWTAGKTAGAEVNESLTNAVYDGELEIEPKYSKSELNEYIQNGSLVFYYDSDEMRVLKDINSFTSYESSKNSDFSNNQVIRVIDSVANDVAKIFDKYYMGKMQNDETGRMLFKAELISYHEQLMSLRAIEGFTSDDVEVLKGTEKGDVIVNEYIEPISAMDKIYMTCVIE